MARATPKPHGPGAGKALEGEATLFLARLAEGDRNARQGLFELVYAELRAQAARYLGSERTDHTLQPTALVHEAWLRMIDQSRVGIESKGHFQALAAQAMRRILVDHARARKRDKRGGGAPRITFHGELVADEESGLDLLAVDEALERLRERSEHLARIVELRFFGGLSREQVAEALGSSRTSVARDWRAARAMLANLLEE